jgi:hypothetical protein
LHKNRLLLGKGSPTVFQSEQKYKNNCKIMRYDEKKFARILNKLYSYDL